MKPKHAYNSFTTLENGEDGKEYAAPTIILLSETHFIVL